MIFVTIGTQAPFDRLVKAVDEVIPQLANVEVVAQVFNDKYKVKNMRTVGFLEPEEFEHYFDEAFLIIAHAGMGTIISALTKGKKIIIFPRLASLGEHRNEHQLATAKKIRELNFAEVAFNEKELQEKIVACFNGKFVQNDHNIGESASTSLIRSVQSDILTLGNRK